MPNIKQQKKRVRTAARQRLENLRYRSTIKTLTKRLEAAVADGDAAAIATEHRKLVRWIDRAVSRGALHRNTAARKKSQAARLVAGPRLALATSPVLAMAGGVRTPRHVDERALELELAGQARAALQRPVELREAHDGGRELLGLKLRTCS